MVLVTSKECTDILKGIEMSKIARISSNEGGPCNECASRIEGNEDFAAAVNHYLLEHHYKLQHVGQETVSGPDGEPWHTTVAVVYKA